MPALFKTQLTSSHAFLMLVSQRLASRAAGLEGKTHNLLSISRVRFSSFLTYVPVSHKIFGSAPFLIVKPCLRHFPPLVFRVERHINWIGCLPHVPPLGWEGSLQVLDPSVHRPKLGRSCSPLPSLPHFPPGLIKSENIQTANIWSSLVCFALKYFKVFWLSCMYVHIEQLCLQIEYCGIRHPKMLRFSFAELRSMCHIILPFSSSPVLLIH